jgi:hypothetical protein
VRYWVRTLIGLAIAGASIVLVDWGIYHLVRTGTCASGGPYVSARPCPPGTGGHILGLIGGIFGGLIGIGVYATRGSRGQASTIGLGLIMWSLLFITLAGSTALAAFGPANNDNAGARTAAIVLGVIFVPMGLAPLPLAIGARGKRATALAPSFTAAAPSFTPPATAWAPPSAAARVDDDDDPLAKIAKLGELRDQGLITPEEFETQKQRLLGEI